MHELVLMAKDAQRQMAVAVNINTGYKSVSAVVVVGVGAESQSRLTDRKPFKTLFPDCYSSGSEC